MVHPTQKRLNSRNAGIWSVKSGINQTKGIVVHDKLFDDFKLPGPMNLIVRRNCTGYQPCSTSPRRCY
jgi:hypothetical protein